ncbi:hypothetical protein [Altericista sp. CCNU0014]|uniref:hypothetical protein n=1 Tax=Altericista sp. CCNU0014 TaxID=3082949 RepID=UPI00384AE5E7
MKSNPTRRLYLCQNSWTLDEAIGLDRVIAPECLERVPARVLTNFRLLLARDVYSEGDAQALYDYIWARKGEMSDAFLSMLNLWLADELKHYEALRRTYRCIAGVSYAEMNRCFAARVHETEPIERVLEDEFTMLVTLMFDEIGSVYSYRRDLREYYSHFDAAVQRVGRYLVQDEGMHFQNAARVLLWEHSHRLHEVEPLLQDIVGLEKSLKHYYKTFFLDHAQEQFRFPSYFSQVIIQVVLAQLGLGDRPSAEVLRSLWQWVPQGDELVPVGMQ